MDKSSIDERAACVKNVRSLIGEVQYVVYRGEYLRRGCEVMGASEHASARSQRLASRDDYRQSGWQVKRWRQDEGELKAIEPLRLELGRLEVEKAT